MNRSPLELIHGYLDLSLNQEEMTELETWIKASPENTNQFIAAILLHDRLHSAFLATDPDVFQTNVEIHQKLKRCLSRRMLTLVSAASIALLIGIMGWRFSGSTVLAANIELQRIIQANHLFQDRTYRISILESGKNNVINQFSGVKSQPDFETAKLYIRGSDQYVLQRQLTDGTEYFTGTNGKLAWSVPPLGRVRVSQDLKRFRGLLPGEKFDIPFINIHENLDQLLKVYELSISEEVTNSNMRRLHAYRKANIEGGPKEVTIWYYKKTGLIQSIVLDRLPQARGGPRSILIDLIGTDALGPEFFDHKAHHDRSRVVSEE